jgi:ribosome biogenesis ATPase
LFAAYKTVLHSYGLDSNPGSEDDVGSDLEVMDVSGKGEDSDESFTSLSQFQDANGRGNHLNNALTNMYLKKTANPVSSTEDAAISIDISSDEEDSGKKQDEAQQSFDKLKQVTIKNVSSSTPAPSSNGTKMSETHMNDLMGKMRPGPASQKKRRIEAMEDALAPPAKQQPPAQQLPTHPKAPKKKFRKEVFAKFPAATFEDVGGMDKTLKELCELILHIKHPEMYKHIGLPPPRGFLLHGPPGSGKTLLAHAIAGQLDVLLVEVQATELVAGVSGESEERIREIFEQAASFAPCVLFIDEIDAISSNRQNAQKDMERRIVAQLLASLDSLSKFRFGDQVLVIGATNRPESLDPALRRVGRFDHEISLGIPDRTARSQILNIIARNLKLERPFNFEEIATLTPGYVGADLLALATRAASTAIKRVMTEKERIALENSLKPVPIVNLDDDSLLMDVDGETKKAEQEKEPETGEEKAVEEAKEAPAAVAEPEIAADPPAEVPPATETPMETEEQPKEEQEEPQKVADPIEEVEKMEPEKKLQLTLENMIKWLANDIQPMTDRELEKLSITREDFLDAVKHVQPSAKREGFITVPDVTWDDIGSLKDIRSELKLAILAPVKFPEKMKKLGLQSPSGVLLCGPPGCGKTLLAKAVANEAGINFISVKGPELLNMVRHPVILVNFN